MFPLHRTARVGVNVSRDLKLFGREIIFEVFQPMWSRYLNVTDGQTDGQTTCNLITALCVASRGKKLEGPVPMVVAPMNCDIIMSCGSCRCQLTNSIGRLKCRINKLCPLTRDVTPSQHSFLSRSRGAWSALVSAWQLRWVESGFRSAILSADPLTEPAGNPIEQSRIMKSPRILFYSSVHVRSRSVWLTVAPVWVELINLLW